MRFDVRAIESEITKRVDEDGEEFARPGSAPPLPGRLVAELNLISWQSLDEARSKVQATLLEIYGLISSPEDCTRIAKILMQTNEKNGPMANSRLAAFLVLVAVCLVCICFDVDSLLEVSAFGESHTLVKGSTVDIMHASLMAAILVAATVSTVGVILDAVHERLAIFNQAVKFKWAPRIHCVHSGKSIVASSQLENLEHKLLISNHGNANLRVFKVVPNAEWIEVEDSSAGAPAADKRGPPSGQPSGAPATIEFELSADGAPLEVRLKLMCSEPGTYESSVSVLSDDPMIPTVVVPVQIEVAIPRLRCDPGKTLPLPCVSTAFVTNTLPFLVVLLLLPGSISVRTRWNDYCDQQFELYNEGDVEVTISSIKAEHEFVVPWVSRPGDIIQSATLAPGNQPMVVNVRFEKTDPGQFRGHLVIQNNSLEPRIVIPYSLQVLVPRLIAKPSELQISGHRGKQATAVFLVHNDADVAAMVSDIRTDRGTIVPVTLPLTIEPYQDLQLTLKYDCPTDGDELTADVSSSIQVRERHTAFPCASAVILSNTDAFPCGAADHIDRPARTGAQSSCHHARRVAQN